MNSWTWPSLYPIDIGGRSTLLWPIIKSIYLWSRSSLDSLPAHSAILLHLHPSLLGKAWDKTRPVEPDHDCRWRCYFPNDADLAKSAWTSSWSSSTHNGSFPSWLIISYIRLWTPDYLRKRLCDFLCPHYLPLHVLSLPLAFHNNTNPMYVIRWLQLFLCLWNSESRD